MSDHPPAILRAIPCPAEMMPAPAARFDQQARAAGWDTRVGIAIGFRRVGRHDSETFKPVRSVQVEARRGRDRIQALWVGPVDGSKMSFDGAWRWPSRGGWGDRVSARDLKTEVES